MKCIAYNGGYKYQLKEEYTFADTGIIPPATITTDFIGLDLAGNLTTAKGYAWDGPSGPTIYTRNFMRGSLAHDALYQLMREIISTMTNYAKPRIDCCSGFARRTGCVRCGHGGFIRGCESSAIRILRLSLLRSNCRSLPNRLSAYPHNCTDLHHCRCSWKTSSKGRDAGTVT